MRSNSIAMESDDYLPIPRALNKKVYITDTTDAETYWTNLRSKNVSPEKNLLTSILKDAVDTIRNCKGKHDRKSKTLYYEARTWFLSDEEDRVFSFIGVCTNLDLDPVAFRNRLKKFL